MGHSRNSYKPYTKENIYFILENWGKYTGSELIEKSGLETAVRVHGLIGKLRKEGFILPKLDKRGSWKKMVEEVKQELRHKR